MLSQIFKKYSKGNNLYILEIISGERNELEYFLSEFRFRSNQIIQISETQIFFDHLELIVRIKKNYPVIINFNGNFILQKSIDLKEQHNNSFKSLFPTLDETQFYIDEYCATDSSAVNISIIRKDKLDEILNPFLNSGIKILDIRCGISFLHDSPIKKYIPKNKVFSLRSGAVSYSDNGNFRYLKDNSNTEKDLSIQVNDFTLTANKIPAFSLAINFFAAGYKYTSYPPIASLREKFLGQKKFKFNTYFFSFIFLLLFAINFSFSYYINKRKKALDDNYLSKVEQINTYNKLFSEYNRKNIYYTNNGLNKTSKLTYYSDQIANSLPPEIKLTLLVINPVQSESDSITIFKEGEILIEGRCKNSLLLNDWTKKIKTNNWVVELTDLDYKLERNDKNGKFSFKITYQM